MAPFDDIVRFTQDPSSHFASSLYSPIVFRVSSLSVFSPFFAFPPPSSPPSPSSTYPLFIIEGTWAEVRALSDQKHENAKGEEGGERVAGEGRGCVRQKQ